MSTTPLEHWFIFQNNHLLIANDTTDNLPLPSYLLADFKKNLIRQFKLGQFEPYQINCGELDATLTLPNAITAIPFKKALALLGEQWYSVACKAYSIITWDRNHQFCGHCGSKTEQHTELFERHCNACSLVFYPRISPCVIVRIQKQEYILMARSPHFSPGYYGLIAGFIDAGENIEAAIHREIKEEIGINVKNLGYFGSQFWPFPDSLMIAFTAEYDSGELIINTAEIEEAGWYRFDNLPGRTSSSISIARKLIDHFVAEQHRASMNHTVIRT